MSILLNFQYYNKPYAIVKKFFTYYMFHSMFQSIPFCIDKLHLHRFRRFYKGWDRNCLQFYHKLDVHDLEQKLNKRTNWEKLSKKGNVVIKFSNYV